MNPVVTNCTSNQALTSTTKRKPMLSVKEFQEKKQKLLHKTSSSHADENEFTKASYANNIKNENNDDDNESPIQQLTKTKKDSLFDIFDD